ncbi:hypothetical protein GCM10010112_41320 [Actinoplanes lobatus]|uniref:Putative membrane protein YeiB n=1 Tax=Actinoplanes lobatus TaxID=113568 RepID=A0A7W7MKQ9_9ACTN|nr:DUF418 domain-containing protein [Actinoplanes lobatus]MBB4753753.1 putative membrane protein YeiB [Actinoplanes lobatus]GGN72694.1 hypothetical protein GCM10010112_41320 [Actinoplanes lobatus]GIE42094.1 hypothetical protein Alo02nite_49920 [Actinoplanes lobatus]
MTSAQTSPAAIAPSSGDRRIAALDVLRGFALCGILLANVKPIAHTGDPLGPADGSSSTLLHMLVDQRFFPIFSLLFGVGFALLMEKARARTAYPRSILLRRMAVLLAIGLVHLTVLWRGDVLTAYALVGLVVLMPSTWLPRRVVAVASGVLIVVSVTLLGGWYSLIPGLLLLGSALTRYGVTARIEGYGRGPAILGALFVAGAVPAAVVQWQAAASDPDGRVFRIAYPVAGLLTAGAYVCAVLLLLRTPLRRALTTVFTPLGRMALTNYLSATLLVLAVSRLAGGSDRWDTGTVVLITVSVLTLQWIWSVLWLRRFRQGPAEWLWRRLTWGGLHTRSSTA